MLNLVRARSAAALGKAIVTVGLLVVVGGMAACVAPSTPHDSSRSSFRPEESGAPCLEIEVYEQSIATGRFEIALYPAGTVTAGYQGSAPAVARVPAEKAGLFCQKLEASVPSQPIPPLYSEAEAADRFGGLDYVVVRSMAGRAAAFSAVGPEVLLVSESQLGGILRQLDRLLCGELPSVYCLDKRCRYTRLGWVGRR